MQRKYYKNGIQWRSYAKVLGQVCVQSGTAFSPGFQFQGELQFSSYENNLLIQTFFTYSLNSRLSLHKSETHFRFENQLYLK